MPYSDIFESQLGKKTLNIAFEFYGLNGDFNRGQVIDRLEPAESEKLQESLDKVIITGNEREVLNQCIHRWEFKRLESRERQLRDILSLADEENKESIDRLTIELMEVQKEMKAHGGKM